MRDSLKITGKLKLIGRDKDGKIVFIRYEKNAITDAGFDMIAALLGNSTQPNEITHMAIGDGVAGGVDATTLTNETDRQAVTYAHTAGTKTLTLTATFTSPSAITEYGLFNDPTVGTMFNTAGFAAITISSLTIVATITLS